MRISLLASVSAVAFVLGAWDTATGQTSSSGMFGNRTVGGSVSAGNRTFSSGSGSGFGSSLGSSFGGSGLGNTSGLGGSGSSGMGGSSQLGSNERFVRGSRQAGQFVGSDRQEVETVLNTMGGANSPGGMNQSSLSGLNSRSGTNLQNANRRNQANPLQMGGRAGRTAADLCTTVSPGFSYPQLTPLTIQTALTGRLTKTTRIRKVSPIRVVLEGGTTVLQGVVETEHDRVLAEQLARLEPGVTRVRNDLIVGANPGSASGPPVIPAAPRGTVAP
jgi:hypothetical protein